jgi:hypothetical protein
MNLDKNIKLLKKFQENYPVFQNSFIKNYIPSYVCYYYCNIIDFIKNMKTLIKYRGWDLSQYYGLPESFEIVTKDFLACFEDDNGSIAWLVERLIWIVLNRVDYALDMNKITSNNLEKDLDIILFLPQNWHDSSFNSNYEFLIKIISTHSLDANTSIILNKTRELLNNADECHKLIILTIHSKLVKFPLYDYHMVEHIMSILYSDDIYHHVIKFLPKN